MALVPEAAAGRAEGLRAFVKFARAIGADLLMIPVMKLPASGPLAAFIVFAAVWPVAVVHAEPQPSKQPQEPAPPQSSAPADTREAAAAPDPQAAGARVQKVVDDLAAVPAVSSGTVGFYLAALEAPDQPLASRNRSQSFITASTMKTLTTGTALEVLGPDFRFETKLLFSPATGDLILRGAGDPSLGRWDWEDLFNEWTTALGAAGIREISGRVIADETAWESQDIPDGWTWLDIGNYYAPPLTPLCYQDNSLRVHFQLKGQPGDPAGFYDCDPWPSGFNIVGDLLIGRPGTGDNAYLFGAPGAREYVARGTLAADHSRDYIRGSLPDPALFCAQHFTAWLIDHEVPVHGAATTTRLLERAAKTAGATPAVVGKAGDAPAGPEASAFTKTAAGSAAAGKAGTGKGKGSGKDKAPAKAPSEPRTATGTAIAAAPQGGLSGKSAPAPPLASDAKLVASHFSAPLRDLLIPINHRSLNLDCECLVKTLGNGSTRLGVLRIREHLASKKLPIAGYEQVDGSGLSRTNMVTPELLARAMGSFLTGPNGVDYLASLPEVGQSGSTLKSLETSGTTAVIHAKSGTIERVKSYTGVVDAGDGRRFIFAILVNNYDGSYSRNVDPGLDAFFEALAGL